jgi:hypothetical protein
MIVRRPKFSFANKCVKILIITVLIIVTQTVVSRAQSHETTEAMQKRWRVPVEMAQFEGKTAEK